MTNMCPICGYPSLSEPAYDGPVGSLEICPSCGYQFGYTDDDQHISHDQWRQQWVDGGMVWDKGRSEPPANWNPQQQLLKVTGKGGKQAKR